MSLIISQDNLKNFINNLFVKGEVFGPVKSEDEIRFQPLFKDFDWTALDFSDTKSILPPKYLFLPTEEVIFQASQDDFKSPIVNKDFFVLCSTEDARGILELDEVMLKEPTDFYYSQRRNLSTIIAVGSNIEENKILADLVLEIIDEKYYLATTFSVKGKNLIDFKFFEEKDLKIKNQKPSKNDLDNLLLDSELLKDAILWSRNHLIWEELEKICLGCGICTYVCPMCYCFSIEDEKDFNGKNCQRCRKWDSCISPDFALIAGGKNFRPNLKERYYNWYYHKFVRAYKEFGRPHCVACGRCQKYCPASIDIYKVLTRIIDEYKKSLHK